MRTPSHETFDGASNGVEKDLALLLRIRELRAQSAAKKVAAASHALEAARQVRAQASEDVTAFSDKLEAVRIAHNPLRKTYVTGAALATASEAVGAASAHLEDADHAHDQAKQSVLAAEIEHAERVQDYMRKDRATVKIASLLHGDE